MLARGLVTKRLINYPGPHYGIFPSFGIVSVRNCTGRGLDEAPADQETELTELPMNYYQLRHAPGPDQLLWEKLNEGKTSEELFK